MKWTERIKNRFFRYRELIAYVFFGACSMAANVAVYGLCYRFCRLANVPSTVTAWFAAVVIAFLTNKVWVFESRSFQPSVVLREAVSFFSCRILTGVLDVAIMYVAVDCLYQRELVWKLVSNIVVIVLNYLASKLFIFKKHE